MWNIGYYICGMKEKTIVRYPTPTNDEKEMVRLLADGMKGNKMANALKINENTLAFNLAVLRGKYDCKNSIQLVAFFLRNKLID